MSAGTQKPSAARRALPLTIAATVVVVFLPPGWLGWVGWFGDLAALAIAPASQPAKMVGDWLDPARSRAVDADAEALAERLSQLELLLHQAQERAGDLERRLAEVEEWRLLYPDVDIDPLGASVIGATSDPTDRELIVRAGSKHGVTPNTVAVIRRDAQLVGRVTRASTLTCRVRPITDPTAPRIEGRIMFDAEGNGLRCSLKPAGDGTLVGDVGESVGPRPIEPDQIEAGMTVRLDDNTWPAHAQMLVIGHVESVTDDPDKGLRKIVTVRPSVELDRISELVLWRVPSPEEDG